MLIDAMITAKKPIISAKPNPPGPIAIIAPTIIIPDIALVTDIKGV